MTTTVVLLTKMVITLSMHDTRAILLHILIRSFWKASSLFGKRGLQNVEYHPQPTRPQHITRRTTQILVTEARVAPHFFAQVGMRGMIMSDGIPLANSRKNDGGRQHQETVTLVYWYNLK